MQLSIGQRHVESFSNSICNNIPNKISDCYSLSKEKKLKRAIGINKSFNCKPIYVFDSGSWNIYRSIHITKNSYVQLDCLSPCAGCKLAGDTKVLSLA